MNSLTKAFLNIMSNLDEARFAQIFVDFVYMLKIDELSTAEEWEFFANGNANCLFKYIGDSKTFKGKLLRLRVKKDMLSYISTQQLNEFIETKCLKLFPKDIISIELVVVPSKFISSLKTPIELMKDEGYGFLTPNILLGDFETHILSKNCALHVESQTKNDTDINCIIIEMKPKWLYQNKTNYCRTCLLHQLKGFERHFCALDFLNERTVDRGVMDFISKIPNRVLGSLEKSHINLQEILGEFFRKPDCLIKRLKNLQVVREDCDRIENLRNMEDVLEALSMIMTLRDVGIFIEITKRISSHEDRNPRSRLSSDDFIVKSFLYDLDLKSPSKFEHWVHIERNLKAIYDSCNPCWRFCSRY